MRIYRIGHQIDNDYLVYKTSKIACAIEEYDSRLNITMVVQLAHIHPDDISACINDIKDKLSVRANFILNMFLLKFEPKDAYDVQPDSYELRIIDRDTSISLEMGIGAMGGDVIIRQDLSFKMDGQIESYQKCTHSETGKLEGPYLDYHDKITTFLLDDIYTSIIGKAVSDD